MWNADRQQQQRKSNEDVHQRRVGVKWSPSVPTDGGSGGANATDGKRYSLKPAFPEPKRSCMTVRTQVDSLATPWMGEERSRKKAERLEREAEIKKEGTATGPSALSKKKSIRQSMMSLVGSFDSDDAEDKGESSITAAKSPSSCPNVAAGRKGKGAGGGGLPDVPSPPRKNRSGRSVSRHHRESGGMYVPSRHRELMSVVGPATTSTTSKSDASDDRTVAFTTIEVREYGQILDVNPAVGAGPAVGLGWDYEVASDVPGTVDEYEAARSSRNREHYDQTGDSFVPTCSKLSESERTKFLKSKGFTDGEIREAVVATNRARTLRQRTLEDIMTKPEAEARRERMEEVRGAWRRWICGCCGLCGGRSAGGKDDMDELWDEAQKRKR